MLVCTTISQIRSALKPYYAEKSIGFVPTMGALHEGHLSLIQASKQENDLTVCSIFVNPTQFNNQADLLKYPRVLAQDLEMLREVGCDYVFAPEESEMYPQPLSLGIDFGDLERTLEGAYRPGHFKGVGVVVAKLFNIIQPQKAYFGQKDLQQFLIISQLINQLNFNIHLKACPTVREKDGLAMSSRNRRLNEAQRQLAPKIYQALQLAEKALKKHASVESAKKTALQFLNDFSVFEVEYFEIVSAENLVQLPPNMKVEEFGKPVAVCTAVKLGDIRLIDNILIP
jgi:pantoate--beta-alanine ligase